MVQASGNEYELPGKPESYWNATTPESQFPAISGSKEFDVAILGEKLAGIIAAFLLKEVRAEGGSNRSGAAPGPYCRLERRRTDLGLPLPRSRYTAHGNVIRGPTPAGLPEKRPEE